MVEHYIFESLLGPRSRSFEDQGHLKIKVISRSRSFQGQGHMKVKGHSYLKLALLVHMTRQRPLSVLSSSLQVYSEYKSALFFVYTAAIWLNIRYLSHSSGKVTLRSFEDQGHLKVKVIWRSRSYEGQRSFVPPACTTGQYDCQCSLLHYRYIVSTRVLSSSFILMLYDWTLHIWVTPGAKVISRSRSLAGQCHFKVKVMCRSGCFEGQGHLKDKIISKSRSSQGQGHLRSRSSQGQGHLKI